MSERAIKRLITVRKEHERVERAMQAKGPTDEQQSDRHLEMISVISKKNYVAESELVIWSI